VWEGFVVAGQARGVSDARSALAVVRVGEPADDVGVGHPDRLDLLVGLAGSFADPASESVPSVGYVVARRRSVSSPAACKAPAQGDLSSEAQRTKGAHHQQSRVVSAGSGRAWPR
jgi:hypothetical protein